MEKMINLRDLLVHEVLDLYSAEEQIIEALPMMIEKAGNAQLKKALQDHLKVTEQQKKRLDEVKNLLLSDSENAEQDGQAKGLFSRFFGGGKQKCRGTEGLIEEGQKVMNEDMTPEVLDAAIIACAQKIEHYEICGYGTARAYAIELKLDDVADLLEDTLDEEYEADDLLTDLAVSRLNMEAQNASDDEDEEDDEEDDDDDDADKDDTDDDNEEQEQNNTGGRSGGARGNNSGKANKSSGSARKSSNTGSKSANTKSKNSSAASKSKGSAPARSKNAAPASRGNKTASKKPAAKKSGGSKSKSAGKKKGSRAGSR